MRYLLKTTSAHRWLLPHLVALMLFALLSRRLWSTLRFLRWARTQAARPLTKIPRVSVLIPVRNEETTIAACVESLLRQDDANLEVIVLDDGSTDGTGQQLAALQARHPELIVMRATNGPPAGWTGKNYACHQLAERATGDWLLFTDADTLHAPRSVGDGITLAVRLHATLLSAFPYQRTGTWAERVIVSFILDFLPLIGLDFAALWHGKGRRVAANGQYLLVSAADYRAMGGHASIRDALVDDFALARRLRSRGYTLALVDGTAMLSCRMYHTAREVWDGFSKNLMGALGQSALPAPQPLLGAVRALLLAPLFAWCYACLFILPWVTLVFGARKGLAAIEIAWLYLLRGVAAWFLRRPFDEVVTTPLAAWGVMALGLAALFRRMCKRPIAWKGRLYRG